MVAEPLGEPREGKRIWVKGTSEQVVHEQGVCEPFQNI